MPTPTSTSSERRCANCFYVLRGLPAIGRCPECGQIYWPSNGIDPTRSAWIYPYEPWLRAWFVISVLLLALCWIVGCAVPAVTLTAFISCLTSAAISGSLLLWTRRRAARLLRSIDFCICPGCHYKLSGLPESGSCPECGAPYSQAALASIWRARYRIRQRPPPAADGSPFESRSSPERRD